MPVRRVPVEQLRVLVPVQLQFRVPVLGGQPVAVQSGNSRNSFAGLQQQLALLMMAVDDCVPPLMRRPACRSRGKDSS